MDIAFQSVLIIMAVSVGCLVGWVIVLRQQMHRISQACLENYENEKKAAEGFQAERKKYEQYQRDQHAVLMEQHNKIMARQDEIARLSTTVGELKDRITAMHQIHYN